MIWKKIKVRALCERHILSVCGAGIWNPGDLVHGRVSLVVLWPEVLWVALGVCRHLSWCRGEGHSGHYMVFLRIAFGAIFTLDGRRKWQPTPVFLPGKSPWVEEPVGLWSMGSQRVRHKWRDLALLWVGGYSRQSCVDLQHQQPQRCCQKWRFGDPPNPDLQNQNLQGIGCKSLYFLWHPCVKDSMLSMEGSQVQSMVGEQRSCMLCRVTWRKKGKKKKRAEICILTRFPGHLSACNIFRSTAILQRPSRVFLKVLCCCD